MTATRPQGSDHGARRRPVALELRSVTKRWNSSLILDEVSLDLHGGTATRLHGANGVGKTTLLRIAAGMIESDAGTVSLDGLGPRRDRRAFYGRLGLLSAGDRGLYARLTVEHNLDFAASMALLPTPQRRHAVATALGRFELRTLAGHRVDRLSMGQRQRLRLALTFLHNPSVVLLDEPRTSLDQQGLELLADATTAATRRGAAVLWCTPTEDAALLPADTAVVLHDGKLQLS